MTYEEWRATRNNNTNRTLINAGRMECAAYNARLRAQRDGEQAERIREIFDRSLRVTKMTKIVTSEIRVVRQ